MRINPTRALEERTRSVQDIFRDCPMNIRKKLSTFSAIDEPMTANTPFDFDNPTNGTWLVPVGMLFGNIGYNRADNIRWSVVKSSIISVGGYSHHLAYGIEAKYDTKRKQLRLIDGQHRAERAYGCEGADFPIEVRVSVHTTTDDGEMLKQEAHEHYVNAHYAVRQTAVERFKSGVIDEVPEEIELYDFLDKLDCSVGDTNVDASFTILNPGYIREAMKYTKQVVVSEGGVIEEVSVGYGVLAATTITALTKALKYAEEQGDLVEDEINIVDSTAVRAIALFLKYFASDIQKVENKNGRGVLDSFLKYVLSGRGDAYGIPYSQEELTPGHSEYKHANLHAGLLVALFNEFCMYEYGFYPTSGGKSGNRKFAIPEECATYQYFLGKVKPLFRSLFNPLNDNCSKATARDIKSQRRKRAA